MLVQERQLPQVLHIPLILKKLAGQLAMQVFALKTREGMQVVQLVAVAEQVRQVGSQAEQLLEERSWKVLPVQLARQLVPLRKSEPLQEEQVLPLLQVRQVERQFRQLVLLV